MGRATSKGNEAKSKMKHPSDMPTPIRTQTVVICDPTYWQLGHRGTPFPGQSIQDLKVVYQNACKKGYQIYSMYDRVLTFFWYSLLLTSSSCLIHPLLFKY